MAVHGADRYPDPTSIKVINLTGASQELWEGNPRRKAVCLFTLSGYTLWLSYADPAVVNQGLPISNQTYPYIFDDDRFGDFCTHRVMGISSAGGNVAAILEVFDTLRPEDMEKYNGEAQKELAWQAGAVRTFGIDSRLPVGSMDRSQH